MLTSSPRPVNALPCKQRTAYTFHAPQVRITSTECLKLAIIVMELDNGGNAVQSVNHLKLND
jgi:hypothetical protein